MFPEWPRRGVNETQRIYDLHVRIATSRPACVAPIGQAWELSLKRYPMMLLHDADGNHARATGSFLTALILFSTLTDSAPSKLPAFAGLGISEADQTRLREIATEQVALPSPRLHCPNDRKL